MGMGFNISWIGGSIYHLYGVENTMDRGSKYHGLVVPYSIGTGVKIPWIGGLICHW
jgi:hypothetical protein